MVSVDQNRVLYGSGYVALAALSGWTNNVCLGVYPFPWTLLALHATTAFIGGVFLPGKSSLRALLRSSLWLLVGLAVLRAVNLAIRSLVQQSAFREGRIAVIPLLYLYQKFTPVLDESKGLQNLSKLGLLGTKVLGTAVIRSQGGIVIDGLSLSITGALLTGVKLVVEFKLLHGSPSSLFICLNGFVALICFVIALYLEGVNIPNSTTALYLGASSVVYSLAHWFSLLVLATIGPLSMGICYNLLTVLTAYTDVLTTAIALAAFVLCCTTSSLATALPR